MSKVTLKSLNWCRGEGIEVANALMVLGIPEETDIGTIETTLETIKVLGKVRVRGKFFEPVSKTLTSKAPSRDIGHYPR
uniref:Paraneoplastic antigen Ma-like N-terminal domain-containing protein n=1 Tax=Neogobius melanostomus TaxID=47308 RepID=A0A8C6SQ71_9GOBI